MNQCHYCAKLIKPEAIVKGERFSYCSERCQNLERILTRQHANHRYRTPTPAGLKRKEKP